MYNDLIIENFSDPENIGTIDAPNYELEIGNPVCGDRIRIQIAMAGDKIEKAVFSAWGCAASVATANIFCSSINGTTVDTVSGRNEYDIAHMLGELEPSQHHCLVILQELHHKLLRNVTKVGDE